MDASFSAGQYAELAHAEIDGLLAEGRRPIVVGGTGLYLRAALTELDLRRYLTGKLAGYKMPKYIEFRDDLPKTNVGKILRRALRDGA